MDIFDRYSRRLPSDHGILQAVDAYRAIVGPYGAEQLSTLARAARDKLLARVLPTGAELAALEQAIRLLRPAPLVALDHTPPLPTAAAEEFPEWSEFRAASSALMPAVGRIDFADPAAGQVGTGFLVAPDLLLTNRHVVFYLTSGTGVLDPDDALVRFRYEWGVTSKERPVAVRRVVVVHPDLDLALLQLEAVAPRAHLRFAATPPAVGDAVVAIGFPAREDGNHFFVPAVFESRFGVKRAAPGRLAELTATALQHDCSTLKGSSGSPLLGLTSHEVVGVHAEGVFSWRNTAVPGAAAAAFVEGHA